MNMEFLTVVDAVLGTVEEHTQWSNLEQAFKVLPEEVIIKWRPGG